MHVKLITFKSSDAEPYSENDEERYNCTSISEE